MEVHRAAESGREELGREPGIEELEELRDRIGCHFGVGVSWLEALRKFDVDAVDERFVRQAAGPEARRARTVDRPVPHQSVLVCGLEGSEHGGPLLREPTESRFPVGCGRQSATVRSPVCRVETTSPTRLYMTPRWFTSPATSHPGHVGNGVSSVTAPLETATRKRLDSRSSESKAVERSMPPVCTLRR